MSHSVYILESETSGNYYVGSSEKPEKRLQFHNTVEKGFTSRYGPWRIIFKKEYESKSGKSYRTFQRKIKDLEKMNIITLKEMNKGREGRSTIVEFNQKMLVDY